MVNKVFFMLPIDGSIASRFVRALCLKDSAPAGWEFAFIDGPGNLSKGHIRGKLQLYWYYLRVLWQICRGNDNAFVYFIKPSSALVIILSRVILGLRTFVDVNDPIHLTSHLGRLSRPRSWLFFNASSGIVFESEEYRKFLGKRYFAKSTVIEDTPQFSRLFDAFEKRSRQVVWYGSPGPSYVLLDYVDCLKLFHASGYSILLMGADKVVIQKLAEQGVTVDSIPRYQHADLVAEVSKSMISFVPMPDIVDYTMRGNLKAKFGMACGCITIASDIEMHRRLISDGVTGYLFSNQDVVQRVLDELDRGSDIPSRVARKGNEYVATTFTLENHAGEITKFFQSREW